MIESLQIWILQVSACHGDSGSPLTYQVGHTQMKTHCNIEWFCFPSNKNHLRLLQKFLNFWAWSAGGRALARTPTLSSATSPVSSPCINVNSTIGQKECFVNQLFRCPRLDCEWSRRSVLFQCLMMTLSTFPNKVRSTKVLNSSGQIHLPPLSNQKTLGFAS